MAKLCLPAAIIACLAATPALALCQVDRFAFAFHQSAATNMTVDSGGSCGLVLGSGKRSGLSDIKVVRPPGHGAARWDGSTSPFAIYYRRSPGCRGADSFAFAIDGGSPKSGTGAAAITVSVSVKRTFTGGFP